MSDKEKKIGSTMRIVRKYYVVVCLLFVQVLLAQTKFEASISRESVPLNENVRVDFSMNSDGDNFVPPSFKDFTVVGGPNQSVSYSWVNGKKSFNKTYSYFLQAKRKGVFTIESATIEIDGKKYTTSPVKVKIVDAVAKQDPRERLNSVQQQSLEDIHLVTEVTNSSPYVNEPVTVSYKIYFRDGLEGYRGRAIPTYEKFWVHNVQLGEPQLENVTFKGEPYYMVLVKQDVLMPQEVGTFVLDPLELSVQARVLTGRRDFFGFPEHALVEKEFKSNRVTIKSKALPEEGKPAHFSGGVGNFKFSVVPNKTSLNAGEMLTLKVEVEGRGNLNLLNIPTPTANSALEMYDPEYTEKIVAGTRGMQGFRRNNYTIIPQYKGEYTIYPMEFSYFDLADKKYKVIQTDSIKINVIEGPELPTDKEILVANTGDEEDLFQTIKLSFTPVKAIENTYWGTKLFYILFSAPFVAFPVVILLIRRRNKYLSNTEGLRLRANNRLARKYLGEAKKQLKDKNMFYEALERCLHNFLKAKLNIETTEMSNENIVELLKERTVEEEQIRAFINLKKSCEYARYAPSSMENMKNDYAVAIEVISNLEKEIK